MSEKKQTQPPQHQDTQPGDQTEMCPEPVTIREDYRGSDKLVGKRALITGGDSGIGRAVAVHFAREGADVVIAYLEEEEDALETQRMVQAEGRRCLLMPGDLARPGAAAEAVKQAAEWLGGLDILVNNIAEQHPVDDPDELSESQLVQTFQTNVLSFYMATVAALDHLSPTGAVINTSSITGSRGHKTLIDYAGTKGAINAMTFSFAQALAGRGIRVNAVAPGPVWTPLIPASFDAKEVATFGSDTLLGRPGQPSEVAPAYVYLASDDASFVTGQVLHVNGGAYMSA